MLTKLGEFDFWHDSEFSCIPQELFNTLVCDFAVEQFTHARLWLMKEDFQILGLYCRAQANTAWYNSALKRSSTASSGEKPASLKTSPEPNLGFFIPHLFAAARLHRSESVARKLIYKISYAVLRRNRGGMRGILFELLVHAGHANLPIGGLQNAIQEDGVPGIYTKHS
jgi:hypothetical protein